MCKTILNLIANTYSCTFVLVLRPQQVATLSSWDPAHSQILVRHLLSLTLQPGVGMASKGYHPRCLTLLIPFAEPTLLTSLFQKSK